MSRNIDYMILSLRGCMTFHDRCNETAIPTCLGQHWGTADVQMRCVSCQVKKPKLKKHLQGRYCEAAIATESAATGASRSFSGQPNVFRMFHELKSPVQPLCCALKCGRLSRNPCKLH